MNVIQLPAETQIGDVHFTVADKSRALDFYERRLGFRKIGETNGVITLSADGHTPHILLTEKPGALPKPPRSTGLYHVAIRYPDRVSLARAFRRLIETDWPFSGFSDHAVSEALYLADADGNGLEMYVDRPRDQWPRSNGQLQMTTDPLDLEDLLAQAEQDTSPWNGIHPGTDIGHVHLHVSDLNRAKDFYHGLIGLDVVVDWRSHGALFLSAGGYHHHLGVNIWAGRTPPPANTVGLRAFQLVIPNQQVIEQIAEQVRQAGFSAEAIGHGARVLDFDGNTVELVTKQG